MTEREKKIDVAKFVLGLGTGFLASGLISCIDDAKYQSMIGIGLGIVLIWLSGYFYPKKNQA